MNGRDAVWPRCGLSGLVLARRRHPIHQAIIVAMLGDVGGGAGDDLELLGLTGSAYTSLSGCRASTATSCVRDRTPSLR